MSSLSMQTLDFLFFEHASRSENMFLVRKVWPQLSHLPSQGRPEVSRFATSRQARKTQTQSQIRASGWSACQVYQYERSKAWKKDECKEELQQKSFRGLQWKVFCSKTSVGQGLGWAKSWKFEQTESSGSNVIGWIFEETLSLPLLSPWFTARSV